MDLQEQKQLQKLKKEFVKFVHDLKIKHIQADFTKQTSVLGLKELIKKETITVTELKKLWNSGKTIGK